MMPDDVYLNLSVSKAINFVSQFISFSDTALLDFRFHEKRSFNYS